MRLEQIEEGIYSVAGRRPIVNVAIAQVLALPAIVVSGINKGYNLGDDAFQGTVSGVQRAARRARHRCVAAANAALRLHYAADVAATLNHATHPLPPRTFLNVNVPRE